MTPPPFQTARDIRDAVSSGQRSAVEVCQSSLDRIKAADGALGAFLSVAAERALVRARQIDDQKHQGPLAGVPVALKDKDGTQVVLSP